MGRTLSALALVTASVLTVVFRRPIARFSVRAQNITWGFRFGERTVRLTEIMIWVAAAAWAALAVAIMFLPTR